MGFIPTLTLEGTNQNNADKLTTKEAKIVVRFMSLLFQIRRERFYANARVNEARKLGILKYAYYAYDSTDLFSR